MGVLVQKTRLILWWAVPLTAKSLQLYLNDKLLLLCIFKYASPIMRIACAQLDERVNWFCYVLFITYKALMNDTI